MVRLDAITGGTCKSNDKCRGEKKKKQVQGELHQVQLATLLQLWAVT